MAAESQSIQIRFDGYLAIIVIPNDRSLLDWIFLDEMQQSLDSILKNDDVRAVITTGRGNVYSNALNLKQLKNLPKDQIKDLKTKFITLLMRLITFPKPTVAAINGVAYAAGAILALAHDFRVMTTDDSSNFSLSNLFALFQSTPPIFQICRVKVTNQQILRDAILCDQDWTSKEAVEDKLIDISVEREQLVSTSKMLIESKFGEEILYDINNFGQRKKNLYQL